MRVGYSRLDRPDVADQSGSQAPTENDWYRVAESETFSHQTDQPSGDQGVSSLLHNGRRLLHESYHIGSSALAQNALLGGKATMDLQQVSLDASTPAFFSWTPAFFAESSGRGISTFQKLHETLERQELGLPQTIYEL